MQIDDPANSGGFVPKKQRTASTLRIIRRVPWFVCLIICALSWRVATGQSGTDTSNVPEPAATVAPAASPGLVWVNTRSKVYHYPGHRWYGGTQQGKYASEAEAMAEGDRPAQNERRPLNFGAAVMLAGASSSPTPSETSTTERSARSAPMGPLVVSSPATTLVDATPVFGPTAANPLTVEPSEQLSVCVQAIAAQSDPAKLATLGERGANPRLKRIMYYLARARAGGADPGDVIEQAQRQNGSSGTPRALLV